MIDFDNVASSLTSYWVGAVGVVAPQMGMSNEQALLFWVGFAGIAIRGLYDLVRLVRYMRDPKAYTRN